MESTEEYIKNTEEDIKLCEYSKVFNSLRRGISEIKLNFILKDLKEKREYVAQHNNITLNPIVIVYPKGYEIDKLSHTRIGELFKQFRLTHPNICFSLKEMGIKITHKNKEQEDWGCSFD